ncbi:hypothetical protein [Pseudomonas sp. Ga0074129]|uniref:hypothetical protein n=1 Tax=Pseudomonas sp. Ga0074129 TaxID=1752219 RepID=UPI000ACF665B|nr:hypothetical protein [Pseudomonas sp. Ga0074129]
MSLADERRAIRENVAATRAPTAGAQRRAIGQRLEAERRGAQVVEDLQRLQRTPQQRRTLRTVRPVGAVPASRGRAAYKPPATGGSFDGEFTEVERVYSPDPIYLETIDGSGYFAVRRLESLTMEGDAGSVVVFRFPELVLGP